MKIFIKISKRKTVINELFSLISAFTFCLLCETFHDMLRIKVKYFLLCTFLLHSKYKEMSEICSKGN